MSELVLIVTDFYPAARSIPPRARAGAQLTGAREAVLPAIARMARYGRVEALPSGWRAWTAAWLGRADLAGASPASIAAAAGPLCGAPGEPGSRASGDEGDRGADFVWLADPVHLLAGMTSLHLAPRGILRLDAEAQAELCSAFDASFAERGYRLEPTRAGRFLARGPAPTGTVRTIEPARVLGSSLAESLPRGPGAAPLLALGAEIEMWLHEHPLNARRARAREPTISTLWLWGGGAPLDGAAPRGPREAGSISGSPPADVFSDDAYMAGLAHLSGARIAPEPHDAAQVATGDASRRIVTLELFEALGTLDRDWVAPALERLARRELARLTLVANDRRISISAADLLKVWRRRRTALEVLQ